ncbi:MAG: hypothetical protein NTV14_05420 [Coprothermobacterota bacterium]|nr:hypothetical protein [Coprothermobacterota bacterium]
MMARSVIQSSSSLFLVLCLLLASPLSTLAVSTSSPEVVRASGIVPSWSLRSGSLMDPRSNFGMDTDPVSGRIVVFGGSSMKPYDLNDLWTLAPGVSAWEPLTADNPPSPRLECPLVFLGDSQTALIFGGVSSAGAVLDDTCLLDLPGKSWRALSPQAWPAARGGHSMVWAGDRVILFGGRDSAEHWDYQTLNDTWSFNPTIGEWTQLDPINPPPARVYSAMSFDPQSGKVLLFGGFTGQVSLGDTWIYDPSTNVWAEVSPFQAPAPRAGHVMSTLPAAGKVVLYGGRDLATTDVFHQTYLFDFTGCQWTLLPTEGSPSVSFFAGLACDRRGGRFVLFGGVLDEAKGWGNSNETWACDESLLVWRRLDEGDPPSARSWIDGAYDVQRGRFLVFGGGFPTYDGLLEQNSGETCIYNVRGNNWSVLPETDSGPSARQGACFLYSSFWDAAIVFGGALPYQNDLWTLSPSGVWAQIPAQNPPLARMSAAIATNLETGELLLFGGHDKHHVFGDTWLFEPSTQAWTELNLPTGPTPRIWHKMVWDDQEKKVLLFGGSNPEAANSGMSDLWSFDFSLRQWTRLHPIGEHPSTRAAFAMAWDSTRGKLVLFGGQHPDEKKEEWTLCNDTWSYDPATNRWEQLATTAAPPTEIGMAMVYDSSLDQCLIFGGFNPSPQASGELQSHLCNDCWGLTYQTTLGYLLTPGWNLLTVPLRLFPAQAERALPPGWLIFGWDALHACYLGRSQLVLQPGAAYWLKSASNTLFLSGAPLAAPGYSTALGNGWNLLGNPFTNDVAWNCVILRDGGETMTLDEALSRGLLASAPLAWNSSAYVSLGTGDIFPNKLGFWLKALTGGLELVWANP